MTTVDGRFLARSENDASSGRGGGDGPIVSEAIRHDVPDQRVPRCAELRTVTEGGLCEANKGGTNLARFVRPGSPERLFEHGARIRRSGQARARAN